MTELTPALLSQITGRLYQDAVAADGRNGSATSPAGSQPVISPHPVLGLDGASISRPNDAQFSSGSDRLSLPLGEPSEFPMQLPFRTTGFGTEASSGHRTSYPSHSPSFDRLKDFVEQVQSNAYHAQGHFPAGSDAPLFPLSHGPLPGPSSYNSRSLNVEAIRRDFPILRQQVHGKPIAWFDNAATTQKPQCVIDALSNYYARDNSNIHRAAHTLASCATDAFEGARKTAQRFLGAAKPEEIIFVRGTTEGINLVTQTYGRKFLQPGDEIILSMLEHHANIVPWQSVAKERGAILRVIPVTDQGEIKLEEYQSLLGPRTKVVALTQASNSLGTILPVAEMTQMARRYNARVLIDGAQSVAHLPVNVQQMDCDFFAFSGHKIFGPTGIGVVYIRSELQDMMPPWQGGGNMIRHVTWEETTYAAPPAKFEAGTPNIADAVGLGAALDYVTRLGLPNIARYEHELLDYMTAGLAEVPGLRLFGTAREKVGVASFVLEGKSNEEVGKLLDQEGIAVRAGHHCSQPSLRRFGLDSTVRPSLAFYNTRDEVDRLLHAVHRIQGSQGHRPAWSYR